MVIQSEEFLGIKVFDLLPTEQPQIHTCNW